ncbi:EAL and HDOD domain-containing protein [Aromatoleum sp.]|uniref:EAL and HDOD domain-containing protein n=1 Tax=Aromatoleum sp. TaxID=2307007 RepID=UPI002FC62F2E
MFLDVIAPFLGGLFRKPANPAGNRTHFEMLERPAPEPDCGLASAHAPQPEGFVYREAVLGADQRVAGHQFMLSEATRSRICTRNRRIHHVYAEVLVRNVARIDLARLLGHRKALLDVPDSFLGHTSIASLPPGNTVLVVTRLDDEGAPAAADLLAAVRNLRESGYGVAVACSDLLGALSFLQPEVDYATLAAEAPDPTRQKNDVERLRQAGSEAMLIARGLPSQDDFQLCRSLGAELFQGPFITRREDWHGNKLGPNTAKIAELLARLRRDADTAELVALLKQDGALLLRMMRYMNSAAIGMHGDLSSIERAVMQLGRDRLYRWLLLLMYGADKASARSAAVLENALVRARLMELLGEGRPATEHDALFLVGLLSLVDVALEVPMTEAMASIASAPEVEAAVLHGEGPLGNLLALVIGCETGDPRTLDELAERCDITPAIANRRHLEAFAWALEVTAAPAARHGEGRC